MNADRSRAYAHVIRLVDDLAAAKLHPHEQAVVREAADALLFTTDITADDEARAALDRLEDTVDALLASDRITPELGEALLHAVEACGPQRAAA